MLQKSFLTAFFLLFSTFSFSMEFLPYKDRKSTTIQLVATTTFGELASISNELAYSLAIDHSLSNGVILGVFYTPEFIDFNEQNKSTSAWSAGIYSGYHHNTDFRFIAGMYLTSIEYSHFESQRNENNLGVILGLDYVFSPFVIGARVMTTTVDDNAGSMAGMSFGFQF